MKDKISQLTPTIKVIMVSLMVIITLYILAGANYLLFHSLAEGLSVIVGMLIYIIATRTYRFTQDRVLYFIGIAYLCVAIFDSLHILTYSGMGIFPEYQADVPTQLWIVGRYVEVISFCLVPLFAKWDYPKRWVFGTYLVATVLLLSSIMFWRVFPTCFVPGEGLTPFKIISEYGLMAMLIGCAVALYRQKDLLHPVIYKVMLISIIITVMSELSFTMYQDVIDDAAIIIGHILKAGSYFLIFWGIILEGLEEPYDMIFQKLKRQNQELTILNDKKDYFLGIAAHDLRNPLSIISMSSQILKRSDTLEPKQIQFIQRIQNSSDYMLHLVEELLEVVRIEAGRIDLNLKSCNLDKVLQNTITLNQIIAGDKQITLDYQIECIPEMVIDSLKIEQVINNLISNAIKFSYPDSKVNIRLYQDGEQVILVVKDEGQGIPEEEIPLLFTPYTKLSVKATAGEKSTGLGLAISRKIVESHGGKIWAESKLGQGTKFYVSLPLGTAQETLELAN